MNAELGPKRLELLHELLPAATVIALLVNPANLVTEPQVREMQTAARAFGMQVHVLNATTERDIEAAFARLAELRAGALMIANSAPFIGRSGELGALAARHAVPTIFQSPEFTAAGGLMSYGGSIVDRYRLAGVYTDRILKGEKPADLPVQQATKFEMIINLKTAKALGHQRAAAAARPRRRGDRMNGSVRRCMRVAAGARRARPRAIGRGLLPRQDRHHPGRLHRRRRLRSLRAAARPPHRPAHSRQSQPWWCRTCPARASLKATQYVYGVAPRTA